MKEESNRNLTADLNNLMEETREVRSRSNRADAERLRMESEARDSGEQLREMAEKVFQLLERLKLAELGKTRAMEELSKKEAETVALSKKNARLLKEATKEGRGRVKAELDKKILQDQLRAIKKHNSVLASRCREEVRLKLFEPFYSTKSTGTGLGLAVVYHVAQAHGGSVSAMNCPDGGAAFTLKIPRISQGRAAA